MQIKRKLLGYALLLGLLGASTSVPAQAKPNSVTLRPTADATVSMTSPNTNFNTTTLGVTGQVGPGGSCSQNLISYLKFDLAHLNAISTATLTLRSTFASNTGSLTIGVFGLTDDSWGESSITYNNFQPTFGSVLATAPLTVNGSDLTFSSNTLASYLESQRQGDKLASLALAASSCSGGSVTQNVFAREGTTPPALLLDATTTTVTLASFAAESLAGEIQLRWQTVNEVDTLGFQLYRSSVQDGFAHGMASLVNTSLIPAQASGSVTSADYSYRDWRVQTGAVYYYWLEDVDLKGTTHVHGPVAVTVQGKRLALPLIRR